MTEFRLLSNFVFESADTEACVAKIQRYIDEHSTDAITYKRFPVDEEDELRIESGLIDVLLSPNQAEYHPFPYNQPVFSMSLESSEICQDDGAERLSEFIDLVTLVYNATDPLYVFGMLSYRLDAIGVEVPPPISDEGLAEELINHPTWLMMFPPEMVETYGREWIENLPVDHVDSLDDGGLFVVATFDVTDSTLLYESMQALEQAFENHP